jgi:tetratricopeptide (TPR) repeat protein
MFTACNPGNPSPDQAYNLARKTGDYATATTLALQVYSQDTLNTAWRDTLAMLYSDRGLLVQTEYYAAQIVATNPTDTNNLLRLAFAQQGQPAKAAQALENFQKYYTLKPSTVVQYYMAGLMTQQNNLQGAFQLTDAILQNQASQNEQVPIQFTDERGAAQMQLVSCAIATLNMRGVLLQKANQTPDAKKMFEQALRAMPNFVLAYNNLATLDQPMANKIVQEAIARQQQQQAPQQGGGMAPGR